MIRYKNVADKKLPGGPVSLARSCIVGSFVSGLLTTQSGLGIRIGTSTHKPVLCRQSADKSNTAIQREARHGNLKQSLTEKGPDVESGPGYSPARATLIETAGLWRLDLDNHTAIGNGDSNRVQGRKDLKCKVHDTPLSFLLFGPGLNHRGCWLFRANNRGGKKGQPQAKYRPQSNIDICAFVYVYVTALVFVWHVLWGADRIAAPCLTYRSFSITPLGNGL